MIPTIEHIMKKRHHTRRRLRFLSIVLVVVAIVFGGFGFFYALFENEWYIWTSSTAWALGFVLPAVPLWMFDAVLSRWLVPLPTNRCPQCGYSLIGLAHAQCPECGLALPSELADRSSNSD